MTFLYILIGIISALILLVLVAPKSATVERSVVIKTSPERAFNYLKSLENFTAWSPWQKKDPDMQQGFRGTDGEVGSCNWWKGNKEVGEGEQEVVSLEPNEKVGMELRFFKPFKATNEAWFKVVPEKDDSSRVSWGFHAKFKPPMNVMMMFMNLDKQIGSDYEEGLAVLKQKLESESA